MQNRQFKRIVRMLRKSIPYLSVTLLFFTYLISALLHGSLLSNFADNVAFGVVIAYGIGVVVQSIRGAIVFFGQSNPTFPDFGYTGEVVATIAAIGAIAEIWYLGVHGGINPAFAVSGGVLMAFGWLIEIFLLREVKRATMQELFEDRNQWDNIRTFSEERRSLMEFLDQLEDESFPLAPQRRRKKGRSTQNGELPDEEEVKIDLSGN